MSVYDRVQHIMIPTRDLAPDQELWISEVADTCSAFCKSIDPDETLPQGPVSFVLQTAADMVWVQTQGKPSWGKLDVDAYLQSLAVSPFPNPSVHETAVHVLAVFYCWLAETKRLRRRNAVRMVKDLLRRCRPVDDVTGAPRPGACAAPSHALN
jgi:hypothetical protein